MMAMAHAGFAFLAMTKTASTAVEAAFYEHAQITARRPPPMKHMTARTFTARIAPLLEAYGFPRESYELVSVVREPVDWVLSWYRYLGRVGHRHAATSTRGMAFDSFAGRILEGEVKLGSSTTFVSQGPKVLVDRLYRYDHLGDAVSWMASRLAIDVPEIPRLNASRAQDVVVTPTVRSRLEDHYARDVALYASAR